MAATDAPPRHPQGLRRHLASAPQVRLCRPTLLASNFLTRATATGTICLMGETCRLLDGLVIIVARLG